MQTANNKRYERGKDVRQSKMTSLIFQSSICCVEDLNRLFFLTNSIFYFQNARSSRNNLDQSLEKDVTNLLSKMEKRLFLLDFYVVPFRVYQREINYLTLIIQYMNPITSEQHQEPESTTFCTLLSEQISIASVPPAPVSEILLLPRNTLLLVSPTHLALYDLLTSTLTSQYALAHPLHLCHSISPSSVCLLCPTTRELCPFSISPTLTALTCFAFPALEAGPAESTSYDIITWKEKPDLLCLTQKVYIKSLACFYNINGELIWKVELRGIGLKYNEAGLVVSYSQRIQDKIHLELTGCESGWQQQYALMKLPEREFLIVYVRGVGEHTMLIGANQQKVLGVEQASTWMLLDLKEQQTTILLKSKESILNVLFLDTKKSFVCFTSPSFTAEGYCKQELVLLNYKTKQIFKRETVHLYKQITEYSNGSFLTYDSQIEEDTEPVQIKVFKLVSKSALYLHLLKSYGVTREYGEAILPEVLSLF